MTHHPDRSNFYSSNHAVGEECIYIPWWDIHSTHLMSIIQPARTALYSTSRIINPARNNLTRTPILNKAKMSSVPTFNFTERQPTSDEKALIDDVLPTCQWTLNKDQLKPVSSAYARYSPDATFHDPIGLAKGLESVVSRCHTLG